MQAGIDYIGVGVGAVIVNSEGKYFPAKRGEKAKNERHTWEFPGGSVAFGEGIEEALQREMQEEYGITISVHDLICVTNHFIPDEQQHWVAPSYLCKITKSVPEILEPEKCSAIGWFTLEEIKKKKPSLVTQYILTKLTKNKPTIKKK